MRPEHLDIHTEFEPQYAYFKPGKKCVRILNTSFSTLSINLVVDRHQHLSGKKCTTQQQAECILFLFFVLEILAVAR